MYAGISDARIFALAGAGTARQAGGAVCDRGPLGATVAVGIAARLVAARATARFLARGAGVGACRSSDAFAVRASCSASAGRHGGPLGATVPVGIAARLVAARALTRFLPGGTGVSAGWRFIDTRAIEACLITSAGRHGGPFGATVAVRIAARLVAAGTVTRFLSGGAFVLARDGLGHTRAIFANQAV